MQKIRYFNFYADEWIAGTLGLTPEEEGIYIRIIARIYSRAEGLPSDPTELAHICGVRPQTMRRILPKLLPKLCQTGGKLTSNRCETEIKLARNRMEKARINGAKGGRPNGLAKPDGLETSKPNPKLETEERRIEGSDYAPPSLRSVGAPSGADGAVEEHPPDPIKELWQRGLALLGPNPASRTLLGKLRKEHGDAAVLDGLAACETECPSNPPAFLVACLREHRANGQHRKLSPADKLFLGFAAAAAGGDRSPDCEALAPLLGR